MAIISEITDFVIGDALQIQRTIQAIPSGQLVSKAWFTVKRKFSDTDINALIDKVITAVATADGVIEATGSNGTAIINFYLSASDTDNLTPLAEYKYAVKLLFASGQPYTPETGTIVALPRVREGII